MNPLCRIVPILILAAIPAVAQVTTSQYDNARTGATLHEKILTPQNVNPKQFGKLGAFKVDGAVYAQPLYLPSVDVPGKGTHDVLFIATEHDGVYAFDANRPGDPPRGRSAFSTRLAVSSLSLKTTLSVRSSAPKWASLPRR